MKRSLTIALVIAAIAVLAGAGYLVYRLEARLAFAEEAKAKMADMHEALALSRTRAVQAERATKAELEETLSRHAGLKAEVSSLLADLHAARGEAGRWRQKHAHLVGILEGESKPETVTITAPAECPEVEEIPLEVALGWKIPEVRTAGGRALVVGRVWADVGPVGGPYTRTETELTQDNTTWIRLDEDPTLNRPRREWLALELGAAVSWRRIDGDLDTYAWARLIGPELRSIYGGQPFIGVRPELSGGALRERYDAGVLWRWGWQR